ncbi:hypothetical protein [Novosphingobium sp. BL-52-GroH]|uniref:hypothetical protein n=1 Tax=Novosphingobium sp. BL-52-GroH TaxID=3349877 RepID=UPI00384FED60
MGEVLDRIVHSRKRLSQEWLEPTQIHVDPHSCHTHASDLSIDWPLPNKIRKNIMKSGGSCRIVPCFALLAASTAVHGSPGQGDQMRPDATEARPAAAQAGNPRAVRGLKAEVTTKWEHSGFPAEKEGAIWPSETHFAWTFNKEFNEMNSVETESTAFALMAIANNNRSQATVDRTGDGRRSPRRVRVLKTAAARPASRA